MANGHDGAGGLVLLLAPLFDSPFDEKHRRVLVVFIDQEAKNQFQIPLS